MRRMTRAANRAHLDTPFDGRALSFMGDQAILSTNQGQRYVTLTAGGARSVHRVTKVIGGRYREDFAGVEVGSANSWSGALGDEQILPVSFLRFDATLRYKGYSVMSPERPELRPGPKWRTTCVFCHNTVPQFSSLLDDLHGPGFPAFQGSASVDLPPDRAVSYEITRPADLVERVEAELERLGAEPMGSDEADPRVALQAAMLATRRHFDEPHLVELGIGCEACHGGAREHVDSPAVLPTFEPRSSFFRVRGPGDRLITEAEAQNRACARCHTVLFTRYPHTWEGGGRASNPGGSNVNSGEARDFLLGGCAQAMACSTCHDPHAEDDRGHLARLATVSGNTVCTTCHDEPRFTADLASHTRHDVVGEGSACLSCHMPRKNLGLAYDLTRYHRIGSPADRDRVERDRPLECAICHEDATVTSLLDTMEQWWPRKYDRKALRALYGSNLHVNVLAATLERGKAHEQAAAVGIAGARRATFLADAVASQMRNEYPLVRFYAKHALERMFGEAIPVDPHSPADALNRAVREWLAKRR